MEISLAGIEEALEGLGYRETSPKARMIRAIHTIYNNSTSPEEVRSIDSDELIDTMWNLGGDRRAIRSRRKNLSSIKSTVNQDLNNAWEEGRNPEGIIIGPLNTFVMSDAAKDKILNSFSGSMGLDGGQSLDRVAEALKIVSDYLSETPADMDGEQLSNLKTLVEGLSEKFGEDGEDNVRVIEKIVYRDGSEGEEESPTEAGIVQGDESATTGKGEGETDDVEPVDEADLVEEVEEVEEDLGDVEDLEEMLDSEGGDGEGADGPEDELETEAADDVELVDEADLVEEMEEVEEDFEDVEDLEEMLDSEGGDGEGADGPEDELETEAADDVELVDEADLVEEVEEVEEDLGDVEDLEEMLDSEGGDGEGADGPEDELETEAADDVELVDEAGLVEEVEEVEEDFEDVEDLEEMLDSEGGDEEGADGPEDELETEAADDVELVDEAGLVEEVEEVEEDLGDIEALEGVLDSEGGDGEGAGGSEIVDADDLEFVEENEVDEIEDEEVSLEDSDGTGLDDGVENGGMEGDGFGNSGAGEGGAENVVELVGAEGLEDADEVEIVYEDEPDDVEEAEADAEIDESVEDEGDEVELMDEDDVITEETDELDELVEDVEVDDAEGDESEDLEFVEEEDDLANGVAEASDEIGDEMEADEGDLEDVEEIEWMDGDDVIDAPGDFEEVEEAEGGEDEVANEAVDPEAVLEDDVESESPGEDGGEGIVELVGAEGLEDADEVELMDEDDLIEEEEDKLDSVEEIMEDEGGEFGDDMEVAEEVAGDEESEADETMSTEDSLGSNIGLPIDQLMEDLQNFEDFQVDERQMRLLAERFDGYLGAMERYYNQYIIIKKGNYQVGADAAEEDVLKKQQVLMADYYMGKYPVTNALFEVFIERTGYKTTAEKLGYGYVYHGRFRKVVDSNTGFTSSIWNSTYTRERVEGATWYQPIGPGSTLHKKRNHPVVQVSIQDARTFAAWTGKRLPSEIEWEAAARSRTGFRYPWGNEWIEGFCNFENSGISDTCPVDHFPHSTNEAGLADLLGNVMEWTADECGPKYPLESPTKFFVAKGGSWVSPEQTTLFSRSRLEADFTSNTLGFRCMAD